MKHARIAQRDVAADKSGWLQQPYTIGARVFYDKVRNEALQALINAAQKSRDPDVVRFYERYAAASEVLSLLGNNEQRGLRDDD